jgi:23S rRNA (adenine2503-C2)-methyltransferase
MDSPTTRKPALQDLLPGELTAWCAGRGWPAFRARQIWRWVYVQRVADWESLTNVPPAQRAELAAAFELVPVRLRDIAGRPPESRKLLGALRDGECVETVLLPARQRQTVCLSSQVGCRFACAFCASGQSGFARDLTAGEMVGQVLLAAQLLSDRPHNVVFMGMGEPLDNYDQTLRAVRILNDPAGLAIGARRMTLSTCGIIPGIERLAGEGLQIELSVSLHAPDDALRSRLMPVNRRYPLPALLAACGAYTRRTGRIVTFEYTLIQGVNDGRDQALALAALLRPIQGRVNLIPLSAVAEYHGAAATPAAAREFAAVLERAGVNATLRHSQGGRIGAACGQLRRRTLSAARAGRARR